MAVQRTIVKAYRKVKLGEQKSDFEFWQSQTPEKRLETLEEIRSEFHTWNNDSQPRLQRILSVTKRK